MLAVLAVTTLFGLWKGMAWQLASLASLVLSCFVAMHLSGPLAPYISEREPWNRFIAMLVLYLATSLAVWLAFRLVAGAIDRVRLKEFDRQMGAMFGLAKGCLLCVVITFFAVTLSETVRQAVLKSRSGKYIAVAIQKAAPVMPEEVRDVLGKYIDELDHKLDPDTPPDSPPLERIADDSPFTLPPLDSSDDQPLGEKIKTDISNHFKNQLDRQLDQGANQLDQGIDRIEQGLDSFRSGVESRLDQGLDSIQNEADARLNKVLDSLDVSRSLIEPAGTSTLVAMPGYRVGNSDVLKIRQKSPAGAGGQPMDGLYRVASDGRIDLGSYGQVNVAGQRLGDVERQIESQLARSLPGVDVSLDVAAAESDVYYVIAGAAGQGGNIWRLRATGNQTVEDAVWAAGNAPRSIEKIWIVHPSTVGVQSEQLVPIQWDSASGRATPNSRIAAGDAVLVSERNSPWTGRAEELVGAWLQWLRR
jgi:membrane protein required for colicin V production